HNLSGSWRWVCFTRRGSKSGRGFAPQRRPRLMRKKSQPPLSLPKARPTSVATPDPRLIKELRERNQRLTHQALEDIHELQMHRAKVELEQGVKQQSKTSWPAGKTQTALALDIHEKWPLLPSGKKAPSPTAFYDAWAEEFYLEDQPDKKLKGDNL